ncbi:MAG: GNAT family N-acetyltransferase [Flexilinea sp.]|nr:GNAT family N-acetyltransferase [Flexilinea sp.]
MIFLRKLEKDDPAFKTITRINEEAFPPSEFMPVAMMFELTEKLDGSVWGIYTEKELAGFAMTFRNEKCEYFFFLAIDRNLRNQGLGTEAVKAFFREFSGRQVILDFEEMDPEADNYPMRLRRKNFYLRCGFHETGHFTMFRGNRFEVVCNGGELETESFRDLITKIHAIHPEYPDILI